MSSYKVSPTAQDLLLSNHVSTTTAAFFYLTSTLMKREHNRANIFPHREPSANTNSHRNYCTSHLQQQQVVATIVKLREIILLLANSYQQSPLLLTLLPTTTTQRPTLLTLLLTSCLSLHISPILTFTAYCKQKGHATTVTTATGSEFQGTSKQPGKSNHLIGQPTN